MREQTWKGEFRIRGEGLLFESVVLTNMVNSFLDISESKSENTRSSHSELHKAPS